MTVTAIPTNHQLIEQCRTEPAPLLPLLHAFHERDGHLSEEALREIAGALKIPIAELFGDVTFYHHFAREPQGYGVPRVCTGPVCAHRGGLELLEALRETGARPMPCAGRCDEPVPVLRGGELLVGTAPRSLVTKPSPIPAPNPGGIEECVFAHIREPGRATLQGYRRTGGYEALERVVRSGAPADVLAAIADSKLAGRGGAGFPTGTKWTAVADAPGTPKSIVCNADEGEP
ncbi:MAG: NAD(P)H-dependent oxidoreductase subunit E, partial [Gemmatimonadota bacterium]|nr:NAD(P)H-dependent oxidoreductase subunit E [Gemmatimonadota bacterium]